MAVGIFMEHIFKCDTMRVSVKTGFRQMDDQSLTNALSSGDERAYQHLYALYSKYLLRKIKGIVKCHNIAEDLLQETFIKVYRHIAYFQTDKGLLSAWLSCLARHTAIDYQRSRAYRDRADTCEISSSLHEIEQWGSNCLNTDLIGLQELLLRLNSKQQLLIKLIYLEGFTHAEAAQYLNIPLGTVKSRTRRAIQIMRQCFY
jgi:RNA polymerase sigma factor (sigma-70 family)